MNWENLSNHELKALFKKSKKLTLATQHYPSRGQSAVQELYDTPFGKLFVKKVSALNHQNCQVDPKTGSLAEREFWAYSLAEKIKLHVPSLKLLDKNTTVQNWLDYPDASLYTSRLGPLKLSALNVFECGLFDWVTGQIDRHDANYLYNLYKEEIILIDSAHSFTKHGASLPDYLKQFEISQTKVLNQKQTSKIQNNLLSLSLLDLEELVPLRDKTELLALFKRFDQLQKINTLKDLIGVFRHG